MRNNLYFFKYLQNVQEKYLSHIIIMENKNGSHGGLYTDLYTKDIESHTKEILKKSKQLGDIEISLESNQVYNPAPSAKGFIDIPHTDKMGIFYLQEYLELYLECFMFLFQMQYNKEDKYLI